MESDIEIAFRACSKLSRGRFGQHCNRSKHGTNVVRGVRVELVRLVASRPCAVRSFRVVQRTTQRRKFRVQHIKGDGREQIKVSVCVVGVNVSQLVSNSSDK